MKLVLLHPTFIYSTNEWFEYYPGTILSLDVLKPMKNKNIFKYLTLWLSLLWS